MPLIPNPDLAYVDINKLKLYCLNPDHPTGKHKAKIFKEKLGITAVDAEYLKNEILNGLIHTNAEKHYSDKYGSRYTVDIKIRILNNEAIVRTAWIIKYDEEFPRLISCYIKLN